MYRFTVGEKVRLKCFSDYNALNIPPWTDLIITEIFAGDARFVVASDRSKEFQISLSRLETPLGYQDVYEIVGDDENILRVMSWMDAGRGVKVWISQDLGSAGRNMFTPGDSEGIPHWSMRVVETVIDPSRLKFIKLEISLSKPEDKTGWKYDRRARHWWKETPWVPK